MARARSRKLGERANPDREATKSAVRESITQDGYRMLALTRLRERVRHRVPGLNHLLRMVTRVLYGLDIGNDEVLGFDVNFTHTVGIVIGGDSRLGNNTIGTAKDDGCPTIGPDVVVGCGARVLGRITIGAGAQIGANAVVLADVPAGATAVGIPATVDGGVDHWSRSETGWPPGLHPVADVE